MKRHTGLIIKPIPSYSIYDNIHEQLQNWRGEEERIIAIKEVTAKVFKEEFPNE